MGPERLVMLMGAARNGFVAGMLDANKCFSTFHEHNPCATAPEIIFSRPQYKWNARVASCCCSMRALVHEIREVLYGAVNLQGMSCTCCYSTNAVFAIIGHTLVRWNKAWIRLNDCIQSRSCLREGHVPANQKLVRLIANLRLCSIFVAWQCTTQ